jgi:hypothetical protein
MLLDFVEEKGLQVDQSGQRDCYEIGHLRLLSADAES